MQIERRNFLVGSSALAITAWAGPAFAQTIVRPEQYGARGDGVTDDTRALQACLSAAPAGAVVQLRQGAVYRVDTNYRPSHARFGGLQLKNGQVLQLNGAELKALPSRDIQGAVVQAYRTSGWRIEGPGRVTGERDVHRGQGGEWGMGVAAFAARNWSVSNVEISNCWGDGLYAGYTDGGGDFCEDFVADRVHVHHCRRNGISIVAGRNGEIRAPHIHDIGGTAPSAGIDFEADLPRYPNRNVRVTGGRIYRATFGALVAAHNQDITITGMDISASNSGIVIGEFAQRINIVGNPSVRSTVGGEEGAAFRTVVYSNSKSVFDVRIENNGFFGGGQFAFEAVGNDFRNFVVNGNRIHASNPGVQGVARVGRITFTGNVCVIEGGAGKQADYFLYAAFTTHGRNVFRNKTRYSMHSILTGARDLGGDRYEGPNLRPIVERS